MFHSLRKDSSLLRGRQREERYGCDSTKDNSAVGKGRRRFFRRIKLGGLYEVLRTGMEERDVRQAMCEIRWRAFGQLRHDEVVFDGGVQAILGVMDRFFHSAKIQIQACHLLSELVHRPEWCEGVLACGALKAVSRAAQHYRQEPVVGEQIHFYACCILCSVCLGNEESARQLIPSALRSHDMARFGMEKFPKKCALNAKVVLEVISTDEVVLGSSNRPPSQETTKKQQVQADESHTLRAGIQVKGNMVNRGNKIKARADKKRLTRDGDDVIAISFHSVQNHPPSSSSSSPNSLIATSRAIRKQFSQETNDRKKRTKRDIDDHFSSFLSGEQNSVTNHTDPNSFQIPPPKHFTQAVEPHTSKIFTSTPDVETPVTKDHVSSVPTSEQDLGKSAQFDSIFQSSLPFTPSNPPLDKFDPFKVDLIAPKKQKTMVSSARAPLLVPWNHVYRGASSSTFGATTSTSLSSPLKMGPSRSIKPRQTKAYESNSVARSHDAKISSPTFEETIMTSFSAKNDTENNNHNHQTTTTSLASTAIRDSDGVDQLTTTENNDVLTMPPPAAIPQQQSPPKFGLSANSDKNKDRKTPIIATRTTNTIHDKHKSEILTELSNMKRNPDDKSVQLSGVAFLAASTFNMNVHCLHNVVCEGSAIACIVRAMDQFQLSYGIQMNGCSALKGLARAINDTAADNDEKTPRRDCLDEDSRSLQMELQNSSAIRVIVQALTNPPSPPEEEGNKKKRAKSNKKVTTVQSQACGALANWVYDKTEMHQVVETDIIPAIIVAMSKNRDNALVQEMACRALLRISKQSSNNQSNGLPEIIFALNKHGFGSSDLAAVGCAALANASGGIPQNNMNIVKGGGIQAIMTCMKFHSKVAIVQQHACEAFKNLAHQYPEGARAIPQAGGVRAIVEAMKNHMKDASVQAEGARAIQNVVGINPSIAVWFADVEAIPIIVDAMKEHIDSSRVQQACCAALGNLCVEDPIKPDILNHNGEKQIIQAIRLHCRNECAVDEGCKALQNLASGGDIFRQKIADVGGLSTVLSMLWFHSNSAVVQRQACTTLNELCLSESNLEILSNESPQDLLQNAERFFKSNGGGAASLLRTRLASID